MIDFKKTTFRDLTNVLGNGIRLPVTSKKSVEDLEGYLEQGIRCEITAVRRHGQAELIDIIVNYIAYDEENKQFESTNYYDKNGNASLTARESGNYKLIEEYTVMADSVLDEFFTPVAEASASLKSEYLAAGSDVGTYVDWLEAEVLKSRALVESAGK